MSRRNKKSKILSPLLGFGKLFNTGFFQRLLVQRDLVFLPRLGRRGSGCRRAPNPPCRTGAARYTLAPPDPARGKENDGIARECGALTVEFIVNRIQEGRS